MPWVAAGLGAAALVGAGAQAYGAHQQGKAASAAAAQQREFAEEAQRQFERGTSAAKGHVTEADIAAQQQYGQYYQGARSDLGYGYERALAEARGGYQTATGGLAPLLGLQGYAGQAAQAVDLGDPFAGFQADPGYQFRQQQGEQAIQRAASAAGGRVSGRTMKELARFNQGLASQEYQNFAQRQLAARQQNLSAALSAQQNQMALAGMGFGAQSTLAGYGMQHGALAAGLQAQKGQGLGAMTLGAGEYLSGLTYGTGQSLANLNMQRASMYGGLAGSSIQAAPSAVPYAGGTAAALGAGIGRAAAGIGSALLMGGYGQPPTEFKV